MEHQIIGHSADELPAALESMESSMEMGQHAVITLCTAALPTQETLDDFFAVMTSSGFHLTQPTARVAGDIAVTEFVLQKGSPFWPLLIPLIVPILAMGLITFGIIKIEDITKSLVTIILVTGGFLVILAAIARKPATAYIERGGKVPLLPQTTVPRDIEEKVRGLWKKACEWEHIPPDSKFVVFSDKNPFAKDYNEAVGQLLRYKQFATGRWQPATIKAKKALAAR